MKTDLHTYTVTDGGIVIASGETIQGAARVILQDDGGGYEIRHENGAYVLYTHSLGRRLESAGVLSRAATEAEAEREIFEFVCRRAFDAFGGFEVLTDREYARQQAEIAANDGVRCKTWDEQHELEAEAA